MLQFEKSEFERKVKSENLEVKTKDQIVEILKSSKDDISKSVDEDKDSKLKEAVNEAQKYVQVEVLSASKDAFDKSIQHEIFYVKRKEESNKGE